MKQNIHSLNEQFRKEFLDDLPSRLGEIKTRLSTVTDPSLATTSIDWLFHEIHSIRGSSSTFGLQVLASICAPLEELILFARGEGITLTEFVKLTNNYLDLLKKSIDSARAGSDDFDYFKSQLLQLHKLAFRQPFSIAVAVNARMIREMCRHVATAMGIRVVEFEDSLNVLQRVLSEPFNIVIVSSELYPLQGEALIGALKLSPLRSKHMKTVLLTSNAKKAGYVHRDTDPDFIVLRDKDFLANLQKVIGDIHESIMHSKVEPS